MASENPDAWPFFRDDPDCVVLGVRPGAVPSDRPPVRIYLGSEEAQYRAERIFFWSIEKVRDPGRVYEVYLMKNVAGFDRKGWRTGFTKYRFAIPDFAGRQGRAIYNDVDQIYLADPALLFDLDMGSHGYLAISAEETSVMLIDCARMAPLWNRDTANREGKHALIKKPAQTPGLWGPCDPHWNARDVEYVEGLTKCLHYTLLHQQPWHPFPGGYSYHPNPLAYIWYGLERDADAAGYQVFTAEAPSPGFRAAVGSNRATAPAAQPLRGAALAALRESGAGTVLALGIGTADGPHLDLAAPPASWPEGRFDAVTVNGVLERLPPADIPWVLDAAFARAGRLALVQVHATAADGLGSAAWWTKRVREAAARHPGVSWHVEAIPQAAGVAAQTVTVHRTADPGTPRVWALLDGDAGHDAQVLSLASALGWPFERKPLAFNGKASRPNFVLGASLDSVDNGEALLAPPFPDLVIACGARSVPAARWLRERSGGRTRLVHLGQPRASFDLFDLIVTTPQERLPVRPNVLHVAAPLLAAGAGTGAPVDAGDLPRPWTALLVPGDTGSFVLAEAKARELAQAVSAEAARRGGAILLGLGPAVTPAAAAALRAGLKQPWRELDAAVMRDYERRRAALAAADAVIVTPGDPQLLAEACLAGRPVALFELPKWYDAWVVVRPTLRVLSLAVGGGKSYRGTPLQQHALSRLLDEATARGWMSLPSDVERLHDGLIARGLVSVLGRDHEVAKPKPLDDLATVVRRVRQLMTERPTVAAS